MARPSTNVKHLFQDALTRLALNQEDCQLNFVKDFLELDGGQDGKRGKTSLSWSGQKRTPTR
jgi:hypothetical protein